MAELTLGTTAELTGTPPVVAGATVILESANVTDASGSTVAYTADGEVVTLDYAGLVLGMRVTAAFRWRVTYSTGDPQYQTTTVSAWVLDRTYTHYGSLDDVQRTIGNVVVFSATSNPTVAQAASALEDESYRMDSMLAAIGYATPITVADHFLGNVAALYASAHLYRMMAAGRNPNVIATADLFKQRADELMKPYLLGKAQFAGAAMTPADEASLVPSVITQTPAVNPTTMIANFGAQWGGGMS